MVNRLLHEPTLRLKGAVAGDRSYVYVQALREMFGLEVETPLGETPAAQVTSLEERRRKRT